jgi:hypothetical protein
MCVRRVRTAQEAVRGDDPPLTRDHRDNVGELPPLARGEPWPLVPAARISRDPRI